MAKRSMGSRQRIVRYVQRARRLGEDQSEALSRAERLDESGRLGGDGLPVGLHPDEDYAATSSASPTPGE